MFPHLAYQVYFAEHTSAAIAELGADVRRTLRATLRTVASPPPSDFLLSNTSYLVAWKDVPTVSPRFGMYTPLPGLNPDIAIDPTDTVFQ
jgi:soluble epoxide hydrolase / lipid-phosphate phosphatase